MAEEKIDLRLPGPSFGWEMSRSYNSGGTGASAMGNLWLNAGADLYLVQSGTDIKLLVNANS